MTEQVGEPNSRTDQGRGGLRGGWLWGPYSAAALAVAASTFALDQAHKWWMLLGFGLRERGRTEILPFLDVVFAKNIGVSYSLFQLDSQTGQIALSLFAAAVSLALWVWLARSGTSRLMGVSLGLIIGGALGNALDRLIVGGVIDYISLHAFGYYWYIFNIADAAIVAGVVGLLYDSYVSSRNAAANGS
ncbi:MAG: signal peptidase II [Hyphomicrobiaceae bacterium]|nr:signal peptidase II [Hyphomicrobiaceae bacterium]